MLGQRIAPIVAALLLFAPGAEVALAKAVPSGPMPEATEALIEQGRGQENEKANQRSWHHSLSGMRGVFSARSYSARMIFQRSSSLRLSFHSGMAESQGVASVGRPGPPLATRQKV